MKNKKVWLIVGVSAVIIAVAGAVAMAASPTDDCVSQMGSQHQVMMEQMVKDGVISAEQAKTIQSRMSESMSQYMNNMPGMMNNMMGGMMNGNGGCHGSQPAVAPK